MAKRKPKEYENVDRISQLPDNVLDNILTSLPIVEAAKTAVLSRYWKRGWQHMSILEFDSSFGKKFQNVGLRGRPNLMVAICQILILHMGAIDGFTFCIPGLTTRDEINPLIKFLSEKKVKHLKIDFTNGDVHILNSYLYSCDQLCTLKLNRCELNHPCSFRGFNHLITFELLNVIIMSDFLGMLISNCPLLQELYLVDCYFRKESSVNIVAPNLRSFFYMGCYPHFCLLSAPLLDQLSLHDYMKDYKIGRPLNFGKLKKTHLDEFCSVVPALRRLIVDYTFLKALEAWDPSSEASQPPNCLQQLKELVVHDFCCAEFMDSVLGLIRISPNLVRFSAEMKCYEVACLEPISPFKILKPGLSCNRLQTVKLSDFAGTEPEMEFVKFLLSNSPQLKTMTIHQDSMDDQKRVQILTQMLRFQRASTVVEINFCDEEVLE